jgi:hypothetical protein
MEGMKGLKPVKKTPTKLFFMGFTSFIPFMS